MLFQGIDGKPHVISTNKSKYRLKYGASNLHKDAFAHVQSEFGDYAVLHEFPVAGSKMRFDMFLPELAMAVEAQGEQHDKFIKHFHKTRKAFAHSKMRDEKKKSYCIINQISLYHYMPDGTFKQVV